MSAEVLVYFQFSFLDYLIELSGLCLETHGNICSCQARSAFIVVGFYSKAFQERLYSARSYEALSSLIGLISD